MSCASSNRPIQLRQQNLDSSFIDAYDAVKISEKCGRRNGEVFLESKNGQNNRVTSTALLKALMVKDLGYLD